MKKRSFHLLAFLLSGLMLGCAAAPPPVTSAEPGAATPTPTPIAAEPAPTAAPTDSPAPEPPAVFSISSSGIQDGVIADAFGARGEQKHKGVPSRSFALSVQGIPAGAACLALTVIDPDGGNWVHWLAANIPAADLAENASVDLAADMVQGKNDFGFTGYGGPTPPSGTHTYIVTIYALSEPAALENGFNLKQFNAAIEGKVLASAGLTGDYAR